MYMKDYYLNKIKESEKKIAFFEKLIKDENKTIERYKRWVKEEEIEEEAETYKKQLLKKLEDNNGK